jgi:hypothetical protein
MLGVSPKIQMPTVSVHVRASLCVLKSVDAEVMAGVLVSAEIAVSRND